MTRTADGCVAVSVRGHTSKRETECTFPKLKLKLAGSRSIKIGSHCGDAADDVLSPKYGRLQNEKSPHREALIYQLLRAADVPVLNARPARIAYVEQGQSAPLERNAILLEDDDDAMRRLGGTAEVPMAAFGTVEARQAIADAVRIAFGQALIGNFDGQVAARISAADVVRAAAVLVEGGGGGRPTMARAGGKRPERIADALAEARRVILEAL